MATKRITQSNINWKAIAERVPPNQRTSFLAFKTKSDGYYKKMLANPENPPKMDWNLYKSTIPIAGMVDNFKSTYETFKVPYPVDNVSKLIDEQEKVVKVEIDTFKKNSTEKIKDYEAQLAHLNSLIAYDQMTMEDFKDSYPEKALDPLKKPTFWPHDEEEQTDYRDKGHPLYGADPHQH